MQVFYAPDITGREYILNESESRHTVRVLRMKRGAPVRLIDGKGNLYEGIIQSPDPKKCLISIESVIHGYEARNYRLHIAVSPLKNPERLEWFIEKSVEIGVDEITPLICDNTEKPGIRSERLKNIIISAMKQSLKSTETILNESCSFDKFIGSDFRGTRMIAHCNRNFNRQNISEVCHPGSDALILIGPEGDFTEREIAAALNAGFAGVHLGSSRLRTETAGIAACHSVYFINQ